MTRIQARNGSSCADSDDHPRTRNSELIPMPLPAAARRVMLVQRRAIESQVLSAMLSALGYHVTTVADTGKALLWFGRQPSNLVISELDMPQLNGFQLAQHIRSHSSQTRILLLTACCQAEVVDYMDDRVVDGWLFKPFGLGALSEMLRDIQGL